MSAIIPLSGATHLPAYLSAAGRDMMAAINSEVLSGGQGFPVMSIKGKVFTLVKGGERKVLVRDDDPEETLQSIEATVVRANPKSRVFYLKAYAEGSEGESGPPDCYSSDGTAPAADARNPQASKCAMCPHSVWGSKVGTEGKGTACTVNTRLAVVDPLQVAAGNEVEPYLLRVPAGSRKNFAEVVKTANARGIPYNALALKIGFDREAPSPKLTFRIVGLLDDAAYNTVNGLYEDETVVDIVGLGPVGAAPAPQREAATSDESDLDAALAAKAARAAAAPAAQPTVQPTAAPTAQPAVAPAAPATGGGEDLLAGLGDVTDVEVKAPAPAPAAPRRRAAPAQAAAPAAAPAESGGLDSLLEGLDSLLSATDD